jgi:hypothetical protein
MKTNLVAMTALASSLILTAAVASAAPSLNFNPSPDTGSNLVDLARQGGGRGGGGGGDGGGHVSGGGGGGGDGGGRAALRGGGDGGGGPSGQLARRGGGGGDDLSGGGPKNKGAGRDFDRGDHKGGDKHFSSRDHDHHGNRHRVFRNGVWVWVYGDYYAGNDCYWLLRRAQITGSPYWWHRYEECVY